MSEPVLDVEFIADRVEAFLQAKLNTKLAQLDAYYASDGLDIELAPVPDAAYFFDYMGDKMANFSPFVWYSARPEAGNRSGRMVATKLTMTVAVVLSDSGNDLHIIRRMLRYQRALKELFEFDWNRVPGALTFTVALLQPYPIRLMDESQGWDRGCNDRIIGIDLETHFA